MCGITGRYDPAGTCTAAELAAQVTRMTATLVHRGPDAEGSWGDGDTGICLGHRRLAVVGLGPGGAQPRHRLTRQAAAHARETAPSPGTARLCRSWRAGAGGTLAEGLSRGVKPRGCGRYRTQDATEMFAVCLC